MYRYQMPYIEVIGNGTRYKEGRAEHNYVLQFLSTEKGNRSLGIRIEVT
jgi:hypothetical protein